MRSPRKWQYLWAYIGHAAQGLAVGILVPPPFMAVLLAMFYLRYQQVEYNRFDKAATRERMGIPPVDDWPSRDIADWMVGGWLGLAIGIVGWGAAAIHYGKGWL